MRALRVVGIEDDGTAVILEDPIQGERFRLPADERLRAAIRGDATRLGQIAIELESQMRPREIQSRIRAGESVEQVASAAGIPASKVERFAYPVLLERSRTAELAQRAHPVREDGPDVRTLSEVVAHGFGLRGQDYSMATWDSWRGEDGKWVVQLGWTAGRSSNRAHWVFHPGAHGGTCTPLDENARDLLDPTATRALRTVRPVTELARQALAVEPQSRQVESDREPAREQVREPVREQVREPVREAARERAVEPRADYSQVSEPQVSQSHVSQSHVSHSQADDDTDFVQDFELTSQPRRPVAADPVEPEPVEPDLVEPDAIATDPVAADPVTEAIPVQQPPAEQPVEPEPAEPGVENAEPVAEEPEQLADTATDPGPIVEPKTEPAEPAARQAPAGAARPRKSKKARPIVPSWEDVLLGTRSNRG